MVRLSTLSLLFLAACGVDYGEANLAGTVNGVDFSQVEAVYSGGKFLIFFDREIDCLDTYWRAETYPPYDPTTGPNDEYDHIDFNALQLSLEGTSTPQVGVYSLSDGEQATAQMMLNEGLDSWQTQRAEGDNWTIDVAGDNLEGQISASFGDAGFINGTYRAAYCRNLQ